MKLLKVVFINPVPFGGQVKTVGDGKATNPDRPGAAPAFASLVDVGGFPSVRLEKTENGIKRILYVPVTNVCGYEIDEPVAEKKPAK